MRISWRHIFLFSLALAAPLAPSGAAFSAEPVEQIAAVVNRQIVFLSDVERYRLFFQKQADPSQENTEAALQDLIDNRLLRVEAHRFLLQGPTEEEVNGKIVLIRSQFKNETAFQAALRKTDFSLEEYRTEVRESLWVEKLLRERVSDFIFIAPKDVEAYYQERAGEFPGKKFEAVEPHIRQILASQKAEVKKKEYLTRLRSHAEIEINLQP